MIPHLITSARALGLGKLKLYGWHRPIGLVRKSIAEGGPLEQWRTEKGRLAMLAAAQHLPELPDREDTYEARVFYLSGEKFWYQTVFCFVSLQIQCPFRITPVIYDDGTLSADVRVAITKVVPWAQFVGIEAIQEALDRHLPTAQYPTLRARRLVYPHLRKLTDIHVGQKDWGLVLDSDMLFFGPPSELIDWFGAPRPLHMVDSVESYGYSPSLMARLAGGPVLGKVNVGLYAIDRSKVEWDNVEDWCHNQITLEGPSYLQEQALTAILLGSQGAKPLPNQSYVVLPDRDEGQHPTAILHHYVAHTKRYYFQKNWQSAVASLRAEIDVDRTPLGKGF